MAAMAGAWVAVLLALALPVDGQLRVMAPDSLVREFSNARGRITGSTATFGAPFYGDRVLGQLVFAESMKGNTYCTPDDYSAFQEPSTVTSNTNIESGAVRLIKIILVRRGNCSFTTKVKVAYTKGAHAVIIVDREDSKLTSKDMQNIIVADDGYGDDIHIPSVLISYEDGSKLINSAKRSKVVVELAWDIPTNQVVNTDLWMSSASRESLKFLKEFAPKRRVLNEVMIFQPHYAVFGMSQSDPGVYNDLCSDSTGEYCAEDPDGAGPITGKMVLEEDVRQLCIHEMTKVPRTSLEDIQAGSPMVEYAEKFWDYIEKLLDRCPLDADTEEARFGDACSAALMREVGLDAAKVQECVESTRTEKLKHEREFPAWSPRALRINGWRYSGILDSDLVTRAICSGFIKQPAECQTLFAPRNPFEVYSGAQQEAGVSFATLVMWLGGTVLIAFAAMLLYKRYLKKEMRMTLREEVMLEVQAQMGEYRQLMAHG